MVNQTRKNFIHIAFTDSEKSEITNKAKEINMSISEFCRQSIFEKIRTKEHPELFQTNVDMSLDKFAQMFSDLKIDISEIKKYLPYMKNLIKIEDTLKTLSSVVNRDELKEKEAKIIETLTEQGELDRNKLAELSELSIDDVYDIVSNIEKFSVNVKNGKVRLK